MSCCQADAGHRQGEAVMGVWGVKVGMGGAEGEMAGV